jgi:hypothetical protein
VQFGFGADRGIAFALDVRSAALAGNYVRFFRCFQEPAHELQRIFMAKLTPRVRFRALQSICEACVEPFSRFFLFALSFAFQ